jgi:hypothetical protein
MRHYDDVFWLLMPVVESSLGLVVSHDELDQRALAGTGFSRGPVD